MGSVNFLQLILGILLAAVVAFVAFRLRSLSRSGAIGAFVLGAVVFGFGGLPWACVLLVFFVTSSGLSGLMKRRKKKIEAQFAKSSRRDAWQVAANGGVAGLAALLGVFFPHSIFSVGTIRGCIGRGQRGYLGDRTWRIKQRLAAQYPQLSAGLSGNIRRDQPDGYIGSGSGSRGHRVDHPVGMANLFSCKHGTLELRADHFRSGSDRQPC